MSTTITTASAVNRSRPTKAKRRTQADITSVKGAIIDVLDEIKPATVRQTYYQLVSRGAIDKTEAEYKTLVRLLGVMRRAGDVPFDWLADNTRWMRKPRTYRGLEHLLRSTADLYRRDLWQDQPAYVEVWLEKDALAGVLLDVTAQYDVPLMVTRGYASMTFLHSAAEQIEAAGKPAFIYYFGDYDPSGVNISKKVEADLCGFAPGAEIHFERVAVTPEQIRWYDLPTRPTKKSDTRSKGFEGESVEVDAIAPSELRRICEGCITTHIDRDRLAVVEAAEACEREWLHSLADKGVS